MSTATPAHHALDYDAWHDQRRRAAALVLDELDRLREDTEQYARDLSAGCHRLRRAAVDGDRPEAWAKYRAAKKQADEAWALARARGGQIDALGRPIDPTPAGRAAFERAWLLATGMPWTHPDDYDTPEEHVAGEHYGSTLRRSYAGDLPPCSACMEDELWVEQWEFHAACIARREGR